MQRAFFISAAALTFVAAFWSSSVLSHERVTTTVTYDREIIRIVSRKCIACHSESNLGHPMTSYEQTRPWPQSHFRSGPRNPVPSKPLNSLIMSGPIIGGRSVFPDELLRATTVNLTGK